MYDNSDDKERRIKASAKASAMRLGYERQAKPHRRCPVNGCNTQPKYYSRLCLESGGNSPAAFSERFDLRLIRRRGQVSLVQLVARAFPSRRPCASGFGLRRGAPKAASARLQRRAARSVF